MKTNNLKFGKINLLPEKIEPKDITVMISIKMKGDLLNALKAHAKSAGRPYQTLMKEMLRESLGMHSEVELNSRKDVNEISRQLEQLDARLKQVEKQHTRARPRKKA